MKTASARAQRTLSPTSRLGLLPIAGTLALCAACSDAALNDDGADSRATSQPVAELTAEPAMDITPPGSAQDDEADEPDTDMAGADVSEGGPDVSALDTPTAGNGPDGAATSEDPADDDAMAADDTSVLPSDAADVPTGQYCQDAADWDPEWVQFEEEVLALVNDNRARGADCGTEGVFPPTGPLSMDPVLRCSARLHSLDMFERDFFDHTNPDGVDPFQRMGAAGFAGGGGGENIAGGQSSPEQVMQSWMDSDGHCSNVMQAAFDIIGVGYHPGAGQRGLGSNYWTQNFGAPPFMRGGGRN